MNWIKIIFYKFLKKLNKLLPKKIRFQSNIDNIYDNEFFDDRWEKVNIDKVRKIVDILIETFNPKSVVDIGCGDGLYLKEFHNKGVETIGCDGSRLALLKSSKDVTIFLTDLKRPVVFNRKFDLCVCFEVAEHIPYRYSKTLIDTLCDSSDVIAFTAAPPGQGGTDHINEQPFDFWLKLFERRGFTFDADTTSKIVRKFEEDVIPWIKNNFKCFRRNKSEVSKPKNA